MASDVDTRVWCDNQHVVNRTREMWQQDISVHPNKPDHDLWEKLQHGLAILKQRGRMLQVIKVASHTAPESDLGPVETWARVHNNTVDAQAGWLNNSRSDAFNQTHRQLIAQLGFLRPFVQRVQRVHIAVAHAALKEQVRRGSRAHTSLDKLFQKYGHQVAQAVLDWWPATYDEAVPVQWCSVLQLLVDFQKSTGHQGPVQLAKGGWAIAGDCLAASMVVASNAQRITWFLQVLKDVWAPKASCFVRRMCAPTVAQFVYGLDASLGGGRGGAIRR